MGVEFLDDDLDKDQKKHLGYYENYLKTLHKDLGVELSDSVRLKNINTYKIIIKAQGTDFFSQIKTYFKLEKILEEDYFINMYIKNNKDSIKSGELMIIIEFHENGDIKKAYFIKKKDKLGGCRQEIKKFVEGIIPGIPVFGGGVK